MLHRTEIEMYERRQELLMDARTDADYDAEHKIDCDECGDSWDKRDLMVVVSGDKLCENCYDELMDEATFEDGWTDGDDND